MSSRHRRASPAGWTSTGFESSAGHALFERRGGQRSRPAPRSRPTLRIIGGITAFILGDQLTPDHPALALADRVLMVESEAQLAHGRFHRQKLHLVLVAMRRFAAELRERGHEVDYRAASSFAAGLEAHRRAHSPDEVLAVQPSTARTVNGLELNGVRLIRGGLFLTSPQAFAGWAGGRRRLRMEAFYRWQRRRLDVLMEGPPERRTPVGGRWNLDAENRRAPPSDDRPPPARIPREGQLDEQVRHELDESGWATIGRDGPRRWPSSRDEARQALGDFLEQRLANFGAYQDAMLSGERLLWHSGLSSSLNLGLLDPLECVRGAERALAEGAAPLNSVEGFVRQIIGWREYVWGMYWLQGEGWRHRNALEAGTPLPAVFHTGDTEMACLGDALNGVLDTAYAHHIERLMVFGNLMLLLGVLPTEGVEWFHRAFIDGYRWVMVPNVIGMATFADGGAMMTKPYAASGRYIQRMSDHCKGCRYDPGTRTGDAACPFTVLYWDFLDRQRERLADNPRMTLALRQLERLAPAERAAIADRGRALRDHFDA